MMSMSAPSVVRTLRPRDAVYRALKRSILLNEILPNAALTELSLAQSMGCSQGTVREALLRLQEDGLVLRSGHRGTMVTPLNADAAAEMILLRRQIETRAAMQISGRLDAATRARLEYALADMERAAEAGDEFGVIEADIQFHMTLFSVSGWQAMEQILMRVMLHTHRQKLWEPRHRRPLIETARRHSTILAALAKGGAALADELGDHIDTIVDIKPGQSRNITQDVQA